MKGPVASTLTADLELLGLEPQHLPPIEKLQPRALRAVMKLFTRSLGVKCTDCHEEADFAAPTRRKRIAAHMWDEFVSKLAMTDGSPVFCDSCHQGRLRQLDRHDKQALSKWMDENFVGKMKRIDLEPHDCETCHVDMTMRLLDKWQG